MIKSRSKKIYTKTRHYDEVNIKISLRLKINYDELNIFKKKIETQKRLG